MQTALLQMTPFSADADDSEVPSYNPDVLLHNPDVPLDNPDGPLTTLMCNLTTLMHPLGMKVSLQLPNTLSIPVCLCST